MYLFRMISLILFFNIQFVMCSGGFDHGSAVGKGRLQLDFTINPFNMIENGQSYFVVSYGLLDGIDIHGYFSHESSGINQFYYGIMKQFYNEKHLDLSTAIGWRHRLRIIDMFFPQLLYTIKMNRFNIGGSVVSVKNLTNDKLLGMTFDVAIFIPIKKSILFIEKLEFGIGFFKNVSDDFYPTYSIDMKLKKF